MDQGSVEPPPAREWPNLHSYTRTAGESPPRVRPRSTADYPRQHGRPPTRPRLPAKERIAPGPPGPMYRTRSTHHPDCTLREQAALATRAAVGLRPGFGRHSPGLPDPGLDGVYEVKTRAAHEAGVPRAPVQRLARVRLPWHPSQPAVSVLPD